MFIKHYKYKINYTIFTLQFCYWKNIISYTRVFSFSLRLRNYCHFHIRNKIVISYHEVPRDQVTRDH